MKLEQAILNLAEKNIDEVNDWYNWREINEDKLPSGIILPKGNQYKKNIALKNELNKLWKNTDSQELKNGLIIYYISTWGGIHGNNEESLNEYCSFPANRLISKGKQGIASWSKAICIHDPMKYAIFDARVSISINSLQIINKTDIKILYPILISRNKTIVKGNKEIKKIAKEDKWKKVGDSQFYNDYLQLLNIIAMKMKTEIATIEMLLFAKAEELVNSALTNELNI